MRTYTLKEASKIIDIPVGTMKLWEKDLQGFLEIPRTKQGARSYTKVELDLLLEINQLYLNNLSSEEIQNILQNKTETSSEADNDHLETSSMFVSLDKKTPSSNQNELTSGNTEHFFAAVDQYKQTFLGEIKNEIVKVVQTEVIEGIKKELSKTALNSIQNISEAIHKLNANTSDEIKELSFNLQKNSKETAESYKILERTISNQSLETSEEFYTIAKQMAETSEELAHYIDVTNNEISCLTEALEREREYYMEDREQFRHEIRQRELAFQSMLSSYRYAAPSKGRKWWKFW